MMTLKTAALGSLLALTACATTFAVDPAIARLEARIRVGEFGNVHSFVAYQHGAGIAEHYFAGPDTSAAANNSGA